MKLASLLAQFLYTNKRLDLPGIGSFMLDPSAVLPTEDAKQGKMANIEGVSFENNPRIKETPELISFIASNTGKIKALAAADLDSHLELARQFLNIGKPFLFEGIGSLAKMQSGAFSFNPGPAITEKLKESPSKEPATNTSMEEPMADYKSILYLKKVQRSWKRPLAFGLALAGVALAIWGGYTIYKKTTDNRSAAVEAKKELVMAENHIPDPVAQSPDTLKTSTPPGNYKFVVETADRQRGMKRYGLLKGYGLSIQMETVDSVNFKLFFILPAAAIDTTRMLDSLRRLYTPAGNMAFIER